MQYSLKNCGFGIKILFCRHFLTSKMELHKLLVIKTLKEFFLNLSYFLVSQVLVCFLIIISPLFIVRYVISVLRPILRPDLGSIVHPRSAVHTIDKIHTSPTNTELLFCVVEGPVDSKLVQDIMMERIQNYCPRLRNYFVKWMGYYFWKTDLEFDITNHIYYYSVENNDINELVTEEQLYKNHNYLLTKPYKKNRSPWEILIIKNYQPKDSEPGKEFSVIILLFHHSLGDGYGLMSIFFNQEDVSVAKEKDRKTKIVEMTNLERLTFFANYFTAPYKLVKHIVECTDIDSPFIKPDRSGKYYTGTLKFSMEQMRKIKQKTGSSFTSTYLSAITAGIRNFYLENKVKIPKTIHVMFPLPIPGKYQPVTNKITFGGLTLPVGTSDSFKRVTYLMKQFDSLKISMIPQIMSVIPLIAGGLPYFMIKPLIKVRHISGVISNFPGPSILNKFLGYRIVDVDVSGNLMDGYAGMAFANISLNKWSRMIMIGDQSIFPSEDSIKTLMDTIQKELDILSNNIDR